MPTKEPPIYVVMTESEAADRIDCMVAVLDTLTKLKDAEDERREPSLFPPT